MCAQSSGKQSIAIATEKVSSRVTPYADRQRDITSDQMDKSRRVYPTIVGLPVVPEEACTRTTLKEEPPSVRKDNCHVNPVW